MSCSQTYIDAFSTSLLESFQTVLLWLEQHLNFIMALNPKFAGQRLVASASSKSLNTLELCKFPKTSPLTSYTVKADLCFSPRLCLPCMKSTFLVLVTGLILTHPQFSTKMFNTVYEGVFPIVKSKYSDRVQFIFRQQIQPWHPSSTLVHEAGAAVLQTNPDKFWEFSKALFDKQTEFFDVNVVNETRNKTYERLAKIAGGVGVDEKKVYSLLQISDKPDKDGSLNTGNGVTNDIKVMVKVCKDHRNVSLFSSGSSDM